MVLAKILGQTSLGFTAGILKKERKEISPLRSFFKIHSLLLLSQKILTSPKASLLNLRIFQCYLQPSKADTRSQK